MGMDLGNFAVSTLNQYLKGTDFPATKEEVARNAEGNGAPQDLLTQIRNAATERFENPEEVMQALQSTPDTPDEAPEVE
jgi:hypothetical protein